MSRTATAAATKKSRHTAPVSSDYQDFLQQKRIGAPATGMDVATADISSMLFPYQRDIVRWALRRGRAAIFADCGLGKTPMQLEWARIVTERSYTRLKGHVLILAPLAVAEQTVAEGEKFGIKVTHCRSQADVRPGINITNYERLHLFSSDVFDGLVLDESSILKAFDGTTRKAISDFAQDIPYRLACTATPAPNDLLELTNHAEFLGVMQGKEIVALFFTQDGNTTHAWRLKGHARRDFWRWMASWSVALRKPSDLGYSDEGFVLPPLTIEQVVVEAPAPQSTLFAMEAQTLQERRAARRESTGTRVGVCADMVNASPERWLVWCDLNIESNELHKAIPGSVEVKGADSVEHKEWALRAFARGEIRVLVSKPSIAGLGLNFQACHNMAFVGLSDCYDEETEILTGRGWLSFGEVVPADTIATVNPDTLAFEWQQPQRIVWQHYNGPMHHFKNQRGFDLRVTPNHKLFVQRPHSRYQSGEFSWQLLEAQDIAATFKRQQYHMLSAPTSFEGWVSSGGVNIPLPADQRINKRSRIVSNIAPEDFVQLAGWYLSEGYCRPIGSQEAGRITITQTDVHPDNRADIIALLTRLGLSVNAKTKDIHSYSLNLATFLLEQFGSSSAAKRIPSWVKNLPTPLLTTLRDTMIKGDGCHSNGKVRFYRTTSKQLADDFQEICLKTGLRASVRHREYVHKLFGPTSMYDVQIAREFVRPTIYERPEVSEYDGMIGCVTVPNHVVIVRRNGIAVASGNSFEQFYQAVRRCWRFGQTESVNCYVITAETEGAVVKNIERKERQAADMMENIVQEMKGLSLDGTQSQERDEMEYQEADYQGRDFKLMLGDSVVRIDDIPDESVGLTIFSPPFPGMYAYTNSPHDMGNVRSIDEMLQQYRFLIPGLLRVTMPGRMCCVHLTQLTAMLSRDGYIGIKDYRGSVIRLMEDNGWIYFGEATIEKNPQVQAVRNKERGLLFKSLAEDSSVMRMALADYLIYFRKPGVNPQPIHAGMSAKYNPNGGWITEQEWVEWASPVWHRARAGIAGGIRETNVLNVAQARETDDERHLCIAKGSLVLTRCGYVPIENVRVGDMVLTHRGRWQPVTAARCNGRRPVVSVAAQGVADLHLTPDHPVYLRSGVGPGRWPGDPGSVFHPRKRAQEVGPMWERADETKGSYINLQLPPVEDGPLTLDEWWMVGRWLGDGHRNGHQRSGVRGGKGQFLISCAHDEAAALTERLGKHAGHAGKSTATQIVLKDLRPEVRDVLDRCGRGATGKHLPGEAFSLPQEKAEALLTGYLSADGHYVARYDRWCASSVSRALMLGMAMVAQRARGVVASVYRGRAERDGIIEGRAVRMRQDWILVWRNSPGRHQSGWVGDDGAWKKVRTVEPVGEEEVWDIQVNEDESFTVEGCIVHNCPLQLDVIERAVKLWSNPGDTVFSPFLGIGSEGFVALQNGRKFVGIELKRSYFDSAVRNLERAATAQPNFFGLLSEEAGADEAEEVGATA